MPAIKAFAKSEEMLHATAAARAKLNHFGDPAYLAPLRRLLAAYDEEARFTAEGRERTFDLIVQTLVGRLYSQQGWREHPACLETEIHAPLVITGIPRSGTTALHKLLSLDPQFQGLQHWLSRTPIPRPPREQWPTHALYRRASAILEEIHKDQPLIKAAHGQSVDDVDECYNLLMQSFVVATFPSMAHIPSFDAWYYEQDETPSYLRFADNLKMIGQAAPEKRWLLKNPNHIFAIEALLSAFPDALIVQTHRNPVEAIPSVSSVSFAGRKFFEGSDVDPHIVGARHQRHWRVALERTFIARKQRAGQFFDVRFEDFLASPMATVRALYDRFDLHRAHNVEADMRAWLADNPRYPHGEHRYTAEQFGLSEACIRRDYQDYIEEFGL